jgi:hypothetical protein
VTLSSATQSVGDLRPTGTVTLGDLTENAGFPSVIRLAEGRPAMFPPTCRIRSFWAIGDLQSAAPER